MDNNNSARMKWGVIATWMIIGLIIGFSAVYGWTHWRSADADSSVATDDTVMQDITQDDGDAFAGDGTALTAKGSIGVPVMETDTPLLTVNNQPAGHAVLIAELTLPEDGWAVIHEVLSNGQVGNAIGAARRDAGTYEGVVVELLRATLPQMQYVAVLYSDNGNKVFEISKDKPMGALDGNPIMRTFMASTPVAPSGE